jgi:hypothetical protein
MKRGKKLLAIIMAGIMAMSMAPMRAAAEGEEVDGNIETLSISTITEGELFGENQILVAEGTTVEELLSGIVLTPSDAEAKMYTNSSKEEEVTSGEIVGGSVLVISQEAFEDIAYTVYLEEENNTTGTETADTKSFVIGAATLAQMRTVSAALDTYADDETGSAFKVMNMRGATSGNDKEGWCRIYLTEDNAASLTNVKAYFVHPTQDWEHFGMKLHKLSAGEISNVQRASQLTCGSAYTTWSEVEVLSQSYADTNVAILYNGLAHCYSRTYVKYVTVDYNKTEIDIALDEAIAEAEAMENKSAAVEEALAAAKEYKVSTTSNMDTAVLATQTQIRTAVNALTSAMDPDSVQIKDAYELINEAEDESAMEAVLVENAATLGIDVSDESTYGQLTDDKKAEVIQAVYAGKPYDSNDAVKNAYDAAVTTAAYEEVVPQVTTAEETEDTKTITYAPSTLSKMTTVNASVVDNPTQGRYDVLSLSAWTGSGNDYGVCHVNLTEDNAANLTSVTTSAKMSYGSTHFGMVVYTDDGAITRASQHWASATDWTDYTLLNQSYEEKTASVYLGLANCQAEILIKNVTAVYNKSDIEIALDEAIAEAEEMENRSAEVEAALAAAKEYKVSTTSDMETVALATQTEIKAAVNALTSAMDPDSEQIKEAYDKVNEVEDESAMEAVLVENAADLGIDVSDESTYGQLTDDKKAEVIQAVYAGRPYDSNSAVKKVYEAAVTEAAYEEVVPQVTTAEETEDTKTIVYAPSTLNKMTAVNTSVKDNPIQGGFDVLFLNGWTSSGNDYGICHVNLTEDNAENLTSVTANAKVEYGTTHFGMVVYTDDGAITRASQHWTGNTEWEEYALLTQSYEGEDTASIYWGLAQCQAGIMIKNVTAVYNKSDLEKKLDAAIAEAEALGDAASQETKEALAAAKEYKISTTSDVEKAVLATQGEIKQATYALLATMSSEENFVTGDINGDKKVTSVDALLALKYVIADQELSEEQLNLADMDAKGGVNVADVLSILDKASKRGK